LNPAEELTDNERMAILVYFRLVEETDTSLRYTYGRTPEEIEAAQRTFTIDKAGLLSSDRLNFTPSDPADEQTAIHGLYGVFATQRRKQMTPDQWPRGGAYQA
jgi:hypothetical protein